MKKHSSAYNFKCRYINWGIWAISWMTDRHYSDSKLQYSHSTSRNVDQEAAQKFCHNHKIEFPVVK